MKDSHALPVYVWVWDVPLPVCVHMLIICSILKYILCASMSGQHVYDTKVLILYADDMCSI
jgi:hypothetical protein